MTTIPLPTQLPVVSNWQQVDWLDRSYTGTADASGVALITLDQLPDYERWQLTHMVCAAATTATQSAMRLYLNAVTSQGLRDGTSAGAFDVADWAAGLMVPPGSSLLARWVGCNPGDSVTLNVQANILRRSS